MSGRFIPDETRRERLADGRCITCGVNPLKTKHHCAECAKKVSAKDAASKSKLWKGRLLHGYCGRCGKEKLYKGGLCQKHYEESVASAKNRNTGEKK